MTVDFVTFCCPKDVDRLHQPGEIDSIVKSHNYEFDNVRIVYQRTYPRPHSAPVYVIPHESEHYPGILEHFYINPDQPKADEMTHGPAAAHYWKWHVINHLIGLYKSEADYIVFSDCDCRMIDQPPDMSWITRGTTVLRHNPDVLIVSPSDGGAERLTQNVSQQLFMCERNRLAAINFDIPWDWEFLAPGEPMQEYYYMLEGRIWRYMHHNNLWRYVLPDKWRYWHYQW